MKQIVLFGLECAGWGQIRRVIVETGTPLIAEIQLPSGATVKIEGPSDEVQRILDHFARPEEPAGRLSNARRGKPVSRVGSGPRAFVRQLKSEGFFRSKQSLKSVQEKLSERGQIYPLSTLSATLLMLTRSRELGRIKEKGVWYYVER